METLWNPTPTKMMGRYGGFIFIIEPESKLTIKNMRRGNQFHPAENIAAKLASDLASRGLVRLQDTMPLPEDQQKQVSLDLMCDWIEEQLHYFNTLNTKQASEGLPILLPDKGLKELEGLLKKFQSNKTRIVSREQLEGIASREEMNVFSTLERVKAAAATGDVDAIRAALPDSMMKNLAGAKAEVDEKDSRATILNPERVATRAGTVPSGQRRGRGKRR